MLLSLYSVIKCHCCLVIPTFPVNLFQNPPKCCNLCPGAINLLCMCVCVSVWLMRRRICTVSMLHSFSPPAQRVWLVLALEAFFWLIKSVQTKITTEYCRINVGYSLIWKSSRNKCAENKEFLITNFMIVTGWLESSATAVDIKKNEKLRTYYTNIIVL